MRAVMFLGIALAIACNGKAEQSSYTTNTEFTVDKLFEHEGCTVYRFYDGNNRYYVRCKPQETASTSTSQTHSCGKNCTRTTYTEIPTETR